MGIVCEGTTPEPSKTCGGIGDALDEAERRGRRVQRAHEQARQQGGRDLMGEVSEKTRSSDTRHAWSEPMFGGVPRGSRPVSHRPRPDPLNASRRVAAHRRNAADRVLGDC